jgi:hypothetical protein
MVYNETPHHIKGEPMNTIVQKIDSAKNFVARHKVAFAVTGTAASCLYLNRLALKQHNDFLKEHGLYDAFYLTEDE